MVRRRLCRRSEMVLDQIADVSNHLLPIHHNLRTKEPMPRFAGALVSIGGKRTLVGSTSHLICSPLGTSGNCVTRIRKHPCNCENGELTSEFITKLATIPRVQEENWAVLTCPTPSCSTSVEWLPSSFAAACALTKGVRGSTWQIKIRTGVTTERWR